MTFVRAKIATIVLVQLIRECYTLCDLRTLMKQEQQFNIFTKTLINILHRITGLCKLKNINNDDDDDTDSDFGSIVF